MGNWKGTVIENGRVAATIRRYGPPVHSKPHGPEKTILYYEDPDGESESPPQTEDFAGRATPGTRAIVTNESQHGAEMGSTLNAREVYAGAAPRVGGVTGNVYANANDELKDVKITNSDQLDQDVLRQEEQARQPRKVGDIQGTNQPEMNRNLARPGGYTPRAAAAANEPVTDRSAVEIDFMEDQNQKRLEQQSEPVLEGTEEQSQKQAQENTSVQGGSSEGGQSSQGGESNSGGGEPATGSSSEETSSGPAEGEIENSVRNLGAAGDPERTAEEIAANEKTSQAEDTPKETPKQQDGRTYAELDGMLKDDLEKMYDKEKDSIGEIKGSGSNGAITKKDLVEALRTDKK